MQQDQHYILAVPGAAAQGFGADIPALPGHYAAAQQLALGDGNSSVTGSNATIGEATRQAHLANVLAALSGAGDGAAGLQPMPLAPNEVAAIESAKELATQLGTGARARGRGRATAAAAAAAPRLLA